MFLKRKLYNKLSKYLLILFESRFFKLYLAKQNYKYGKKSAF